MSNFLKITKNTIVRTSLITRTYRDEYDDEISIWFSDMPGKETFIYSKTTFRFKLWLFMRNFF